MVVDPEQLEDFVPIKRGYDKKAFYGPLITAMVMSALFFGITAGWPLHDGMSWWGRMLYIIGGCGMVWVVHWFGGGTLKGILIIPVYFLVIYCGFLFAGSSVSSAGTIAYTGGIFTFILCIPFGGTLGWFLQQTP